MPQEMTPVYERIEEMAEDFARDLIGIIREAPLQELVDLLAGEDGAPDAPTGEPAAR